MTHEIDVLTSQAPDLASLLAGAYGYLSAAVDEYLHSDNVDTDEFHADFHRLQHEITKAMQRMFAEKGITLTVLADGVRDVADALDLPNEEVEKVVRRALSYVFPTGGVTNS